MVVVCSGGATVEQYCPRSDIWSAVASMPRRRLQFAVAVAGQRLYIVGGRDGLRTLDVVQVFDVSSRSWSSVSAMNTHRHGLGQNTYPFLSRASTAVLTCDIDIAILSVRPSVTLRYCIETA